MPPESGEEKPNDQIQCGMGAVAGSGHHLWQLKQTADSSSESMAEPPPACCPCASMHRSPSTWACTFLDLAAAKSDLLDPRHCLPARRSMDLATGTEREDAPYQTRSTVAPPLRKNTTAEPVFSPSPSTRSSGELYPPPPCPAGSLTVVGARPPPFAPPPPL
jgi:hypothetical protein